MWRGYLGETEKAAETRNSGSVITVAHFVSVMCSFALGNLKCSNSECWLFPRLLQSQSTFSNRQWEGEKTKSYPISNCSLFLLPGSAQPTVARCRN